MSLFAALSTTLTGLKAQSASVNSISNNITNLDTTAFKSSSVSFSNIVTGLVGGGVTANLRNDIDTQGAIQSTGISTDLAIQGKGFFVTENSSGGIFYTRAGSFRPDSNGNLVNESGLKLMGWPLDSEGRLPGEPGNINTTSNQDVTSLSPVSTSSIAGTASPTSQISARINLKAEQSILEGPGAVINFTQGQNNSINADTIIVPSGNMASGDIITLTPGTGSPVSFTYGGFSESFDLSQTSVGGASSPLETMSGFSNGSSFVITPSAGSNIDPVNITFNLPANIENNEFSNLNELAQVINSNDGYSAKIANNRLYVALESPQFGFTFSDVSSSGLVSTLGFSNIFPASDRFSSLRQLSDFVNRTNSFKSKLNESVSSSSLKIYNIDSTDSIRFSDSTGGNDLLNEFGLPTSVVDPAYDPLSTLPYKSMASGTIVSDFSRTISIYSSLGEKIDLQLAFKKISDGDGGQNWALELFSPDPAKVVVEGRDDGLLAHGLVSFNGDGTLASISDNLVGEISIDPAGGAIAQNINLAIGTPGGPGFNLRDGLTQFAGNYSVEELSQNGYPTGSLEALQIDTEGYVTAIFSNSLTSRVFKLPLAYFDNPNGLTPQSGNAFSSNYTAGEVRFNQVGDASAGSIIPYGLELSSVDISDELTKLIVSQQGYTASGNVLRKLTELFKTLENL